MYTHAYTDVFVCITSIIIVWAARGLVCVTCNENNTTTNIMMIIPLLIQSCNEDNTTTNIIMNIMMMNIMMKIILLLILIIIITLYILRSSYI